MITDAEKSLVENAVRANVGHELSSDSFKSRLKTLEKLNQYKKANGRLCTDDEYVKSRELPCFISPAAPNFFRNDRLERSKLCLQTSVEKENDNENFSDGLNRREGGLVLAGNYK